MVKGVISQIMIQLWINPNLYFFLTKMAGRLPFANWITWKRKGYPESRIIPILKTPTQCLFFWNEHRLKYLWWRVPFPPNKKPRSLLRRGVFGCRGSYSFLFEKMKKDSDGNSHKISIKSFYRSIYVLKNFKSRKIEFSGISSISPSR